MSSNVYNVSASTWIDRPQRTQLRMTRAGDKLPIAYTYTRAVQSSCILEGITKIYHEARSNRKTEKAIQESILEVFSPRLIERIQFSYQQLRRARNQLRFVEAHPKCFTRDDREYYFKVYQQAKTDLSYTDKRSVLEGITQKVEKKLEKLR
jgi:hypothetical protein